MGTVIPRSGGEYVYLLKTFSKLHRFWGPLPAFLCAWLYLVVLKPAACAVIILTCAEYAIQPFAVLLNFENLDASGQKTIIQIFGLLILGTFQ